MAETELVITEPTVRLCWNDYAIRGAVQALRAANLTAMADDMEAQLRPAIDEPMAVWSLVAAIPGFDDQPRELARLDGGRWVDIEGNDCGPWESLHVLEVLRVGIGEPEEAVSDRASVSTQDYQPHPDDLVAEILRRLRKLRSEAITSERKRAYDIALITVEELQP